MDANSTKCVMIIDENLHAGVIANTAAILGITLGKLFPDAVGTNVTDKSGNAHLGITEFPVPVLRGSPELIKEVRQRLYTKEFEDVTAVDFSDTAQGCKTYDEFVQKIAETEEEKLLYLGIGLFGGKKKNQQADRKSPFTKIKSAYQVDTHFFH